MIIYDVEYSFYKKPSKKCMCSCFIYDGSKYFFPSTTVEEISQISQWDPGYVVWAFKFWGWLLGKGITITEYDRIDYKTWAEKGIVGLEQSTSAEELEFYRNNTKDLESYSQDIQNLLEYKNFVHKRQNPTFGDLEDAYRKGLVCELVLNSQVLDNSLRFTLHRVVPVEITEDSVAFHDPDIGPARRVSRELFKKSWLGTVSEPELCIYSK